MGCSSGKNVKAYNVLSGQDGNAQPVYRAYWTIDDSFYSTTDTNFATVSSCADSCVLGIDGQEQEQQQQQQEQQKQHQDVAAMFQIKASNGQNGAADETKVKSKSKNKKKRKPKT